MGRNCKPLKVDKELLENKLLSTQELMKVFNNVSRATLIVKFSSCIVESFRDNTKKPFNKYCGNCVLKIIGGDNE